jgi:hypothetical protein
MKNRLVFFKHILSVVLLLSLVNVYNCNASDANPTTAKEHSLNEETVSSYDHTSQEQTELKEVNSEPDLCYRARTSIKEYRKCIREHQKSTAQRTYKNNANGSEQSTLPDRHLEEATNEIDDDDEDWRSALEARVAKLEAAAADAQFIQKGKKKGEESEQLRKSLDKCMDFLSTVRELYHSSKGSHEQFTITGQTTTATYDSFTSKTQT